VAYQHLGRVGELLVALELERMEIDGRIVNWNGADVLAYTDRPIRIEVKARTITEQGSWKFRTESKICDLYAFVALETEKIVFMHYSDCRFKSIRLRPEDFQKKTETTWASAVAKVHEGHTRGINTNIAES
jgi:hypothetical protein